MSERPCEPTFRDEIPTAHGEVKVYRCSWGWCVMRGEVAGRSRYLDEAFELAVGERLERSDVRDLVEMLDRELTARRDRAGGATVSRALTLPDWADGDDLSTLQH